MSKSKDKGQGHQGQKHEKKTAESSPLKMHTVTCAP